MIISIVFHRPLDEMDLHMNLFCARHLIREQFTANGMVPATTIYGGEALCQPCLKTVVDYEDATGAAYRQGK